MAYNKREFIQQAAIHIGAALVKAFDETADGIIDNDAVNEKLSDKAARLACDLAETLDVKFSGFYESNVFDKEI